ncbi:MAG: hypothetical protein DLM50_01915 [Candidatus Meridianibacter frigidus]|nr:MAG: hypothetical protein DLM50_01915 [Candidatus Eremiobacteraeota bacterium]
MLAAARTSDHREAFRRLKAGLDAKHRETLAARLAGLDSTLFQTGIPPLDRALGGGLARGMIATLEGPVSSGRTALAARLLTMATTQGLGAAIDEGRLYPPALAEAGVRLERLLVVPAAQPLGIARAADILLRSRAFGVVLMPGVALSAAIWTRLAGLTHHAGAVLIALAIEASDELRYFAGVRMQCAIERVFWTHSSGIFCELGGYEVRCDIVKNKRAAPGAGAVIRIERGAHAAMY